MSQDRDKNSNNDRRSDPYRDLGTDRNPYNRDPYRDMGSGGANPHTRGGSSRTGGYDRRRDPNRD